MTYNEMCETWAEDGSVLKEDHITRGLAIDQQEGGGHENLRVVRRRQDLEAVLSKAAPAWLEQSLPYRHGHHVR